MTKSFFEQLGGSYTQQGDYLLPDLKLPETEQKPIGVWGRRYGRWLKVNHRVLYYNLLTSGKLHEHLAEVEERANDLFLRLIKELSEKEGVTEQLKAENMVAWIGKMNNKGNTTASTALHGGTKSRTGRRFSPKRSKVDKS